MFVIEFVSCLDITLEHCHAHRSNSVLLVCCGWVWVWVGFGCLVMYSSIKKAIHPIVLFINPINSYVQWKIDMIWYTLSILSKFRSVNLSSSRLGFCSILLVLFRFYSMNTQLKDKGFEDWWDIDLHQINLKVERTLRCIVLHSKGVSTVSSIHLRCNSVDILFFSSPISF